MATQKFSELTTTATPNSASVFAIAYSGTSYGVTLANIAANLPATTATSLTSSGTLTVSGNATISGDLTVSGDDITMNTNTSGAALIADGTNFNPVVISGDIAIAAGGAATIQATSVEGSMLNNNVISGQTEITSGLADADELLYSDAGVLKKVGMDTAKSFFHSSTATNITVADESSDTTCFPVFVTAATGDLPPKSGTNLAFNSASGLLTATGFSGPLTGNVTGNASGSSGSCTGNSATASSAATLTTARNIGGVSFNGSANIDLPGVNAAGNQATSGLAATATALASARNIGGVSFDGTGNIDLPGVNAAGNQNTSGTAAIATTVTVADESSDTTCFPLFATAATGNLGPKSAAGLTFNSSTDVLSGTFAGNITGNVTGNTSGSSGSATGNAATATALASARTIGGVSFDGTGNINLPGVNTAGNQATSGLAATATLAATTTALASARTIGGVSFDGTGNINLPGVNSAGNQDTSGTAADATVLETARTIGGVSFNGSANINLPGVNASGSQNTSGTAAGLSATLVVGSGGTGATTLTANGVLIGNGTSAIASVDMSTKGKILLGDGSGNPSLLTVGANDTVLTADSGEATGVKWAAAGGGGGGLAVITAVDNYDGSSPYASYSFTGFSSSYDNYLVLVHAISLAGDGDINFQWLDDGAAVDGGGYRVALNGIDSNATDRQLAANNVTSPRIYDDLKGGDDRPFSGFMYIQNGRGGRWDSDSTDSEGAVRAQVTAVLTGKDHSNYARSIHGGWFYDDAAANTLNGFKLSFAATATKVCLTVYGVVRS